MSKRIHIAGSGIAGLSTASFLAKAGYEVHLSEKNETIGGRARVFQNSGFTFDMGPSWYWMPEVFENFYNQFGHTTADFYDLKRLSPSYRIFWENDEVSDVPASLSEFEAWFESMEAGSAAKLQQFLKEAAYKYNLGMNELVFKPGLSWTEFIDGRVLSGLFKLHVTSSFSSYIRKYFKHPKILSILEFPVLFLGAMPKDTPALYSLMNYADIQLGTWYPMGGMYKIIEAFEKIAIEQGVVIETKQEVLSYHSDSKKVREAIVDGNKLGADIFVSGADYHHTDQNLLLGNSNYSKKYWDSRKMAPSSLLFYLGINKKIDNLLHHNLFFDASFDEHAKDIYLNPTWPKTPLFYACCPSKTDGTVAPEVMENLFLLIPLAPDLEDTEQLRELYFEKLIDRLEKRTASSIREHIVFKKSYCVSDFKKDYHAFKGNAYGLANTLFQTAKFKPSIRHKKFNNFFFTGQLTVPGPGVPPSIISGEVVANEIIRQIKNNRL